MINKIGLWLLRMVLSISLAVTAWAKDEYHVSIFIFIALIASFYTFNERDYDDQPKQPE